VESFSTSTDAGAAASSVWLTRSDPTLTRRNVGVGQHGCSPRRTGKGGTCVFFTVRHLDFFSWAPKTLRLAALPPPCPTK